MTIEACRPQEKGQGRRRGERIKHKDPERPPVDESGVTEVESINRGNLLYQRWGEELGKLGLSDPNLDTLNDMLDRIEGDRTRRDIMLDGFLREFARRKIEKERKENQADHLVPEFFKTPITEQEIEERMKRERSKVLVRMEERREERFNPED